MSSTDNMKTKLEQIPNSVSGDGKSFVAQLKRFLKGFRDDTEEKIDEIGAGSVEQVINLSLAELHSYDANGYPVNNILVQFDKRNIQDYLNAQIWMKKSTENAYKMVGTASYNAGSNMQEYTIADVVTGITYNVKVVACSTHAGTSDFDTAPMAEITVEGSSYIPAAPTQFFLTWDDQGPLWKWDYIDNGYVDFFELRMDGYAGVWNSNRLDSTHNNYSRVAPPVQSGTAYLFIRNVYGAYSLPATHTFNIVAPRKPANPTLDIGLDGVVITMEALPSGCYGYVLEITDFESHTETFETSNNQFTFFQFSGSVSVRYAFKAVVGNGHGEWSNSVSTTIAGEHIDGGRIKANAITTAKLAANAVTSSKIYSGNVQADRIQTQNLAVETKDGSTIITPGAISTGNIQTGAIIADKIAANTITSDQLQVRRVDTGGTVITPGAVATANLRAGAVTADKISVNSLSAITANVGTLTGGSITGTELIGSTIKNAATSPTFIVDSNGTVTGAKIIGSTIQNAATNPTFVVNSNGNVTGATISGSTIIGSTIQNAATNPTFSVDASGNIMGATLLSGSIAASMIGAGAITSDKIAGNTLSAVKATLGEFASAPQGQPRVVIKDSLIEVYSVDGNGNNVLRVRMGIWN